MEARIINLLMRIHWVSAGCALALLAAPASGQDPNEARALAATCFTCHGSEGRSVGGVPAALAGRDRGELLQELRDFKSGKRPGTVMHQHASGYTDEQLDIISGYFSRVKPGPVRPAPPARGPR
jgi:cytochrome c553